jgi:hypothetical protein
MNERWKWKKRHMNQNIVSIPWQVDLTNLFSKGKIVNQTKLPLIIGRTKKMENNRKFLELNALSLLAIFNNNYYLKQLANMCFIFNIFP